MNANKGGVIMNARVLNDIRRKLRILKQVC